MIILPATFPVAEALYLAAISDRRYRESLRDRGELLINPADLEAARLEALTQKKRNLGTHTHCPSCGFTLDSRERLRWETTIDGVDVLMHAGCP